MNVTGRLLGMMLIRCRKTTFCIYFEAVCSVDYGFYGYDKINDQTLYGDLMLNINRTLGDFRFHPTGCFDVAFELSCQRVPGWPESTSNVFTPNAIDYGNATNDNRPILAIQALYQLLVPQC